MKKIFIALAALVPFLAMSVDAKMTHKWDEEHYAKGEFHVKKHDYPRSRKQDTTQTTSGELPNEQGVAREDDGSVRIDHKGRIYKSSEYPAPRHPTTAQ